MDWALLKDIADRHCHFIKYLHDQCKEGRSTLTHTLRVTKNTFYADNGECSSDVSENILQWEPYTKNYLPYSMADWLFNSLVSTGGNITPNDRWKNGYAS
jgi:hypothetical protein